MKIRLKVAAGLIVSLLFTSWLASDLYTTTQEMETAVARLDRVDNLFQDVAALSLLTSDYISSPGNRAQRQWELSYSSAGQIIGNLSSTGADDEATIDRLGTFHLELGAIFGDLVLLYETTGGNETQLSTDQEIGLVSQMIIKMQSIISDTQVLRIGAEQVVTDAQSDTVQITILFIGAMLALLVMTTAMLYLSIIRPLERLRRAAKIVGEGNLDHRVRVRGRGSDEVQALGESFNQMVGELQSYSEHLEQMVSSRTRKLEQVNAELDRFAYAVSHDLKAPLRNIANLVEWIDEDAGEGFSEEVKADFDDLGRQVVRMENMIHGVLEYSRVSRAKSGTELVDIGEVVEEAVAMLAPPAHIALQVPDDLPVIEGNRFRLGQVFQNLMGNAIKYNDKDAGLIRITWSPHGESHFVFGVIDNGPGIAPKYHEWVFRLFKAGEREQDSTGVGLSLVEKIIEDDGGKIWLESEEGCGASFFFTLPRPSDRPSRLPSSGAFQRLQAIQGTAAGSEVPEKVPPFERAPSVFVSQGPGGDDTGPKKQLNSDRNDSIIRS